MRRRTIPTSGFTGAAGELYGWYGIGQSLLMLPADIVGTYIERLPAFDRYDADPTVRDIFVSYTTSILICVLSALVCFRLLELLGFSIQAAGCRSAGADFLHDVSPLHAEPDGEQLYFPADIYRGGVSVRMVAERRTQGAADRVAGAGSEFADAADHGTRFAGGGAVSGVGLARCSCRRAGERASHRLRQAGAAGVRDFLRVRSRLSVLSVRLDLQHVYRRLCARTAAAESGAARGISVGDAFSRGVFRRAFHAGEVTFSCSTRCWC